MDTGVVIRTQSDVFRIFPQISAEVLCSELTKMIGGQEVTAAMVPFETMP